MMNGTIIAPLSLSVQRVLSHLRAGTYNKISRWDVIGSVDTICRELSASGDIESWHREFLLTLQDSAKESL